MVDGPAHLLGGLVDLEGHHHLAGLVGLGDGLAVVEIGCQRHEPGRGEAVGDVLDVTAR
jgi:hypothetical protein